MRRLLALAPLVCACVPLQTETLPASEAKSVVLVRKGLDGVSALFFADVPFAVPAALGPALIFEFDRTLPELGLAEGGASLPAAAPRRSPLPSPLARFELDDQGMHQSATTTVGLELPALDLSAVLSRDCLEPPGFVASTCGATISFDSFQVASPALPNVKGPDGRCPDGWAEVMQEVDRGPTLGPLSIPYCAPPSRQRCAPHQMQAAGDLTCRPVGAACPAGPFPDAVPPGAAYVLSGANGGDGSLARPFGSLNQALRAMPAPAAIALGRGSYVEGVVLTGAVALIGACAEHTEIVGTVVLDGHRGLLRDLRIRSGQRSLLARGTSVSTLRGVEVLGLGTVRVEAGARLRFEDGLIGPVSVSTAQLELVGSELRGPLAAESSALLIETSVVTSTSAAESITTLDTQLDVDRAVLGLPLYAAGTSRTTVRRSWIELRGTDWVHERNAISSDGLALVVEKSTFATREILVPAPLTEEDTAIGQVSIIPHSRAASIEDCLFLLAREQSYAAVLAISFSLPPQSAPYQLRRLAVVGGTRQAQISMEGSAQLEDIRFYESSGQALFMTMGTLSAERLEVGRTRAGVLLASGDPLQATLRDLRLGDLEGVGLSVRSLGASLDADVRRVLVSSGASNATGLSLRADSPGPNPRGLVKLLIRDLKVDGPINTSLELGLDAQVDLQNFSFSGASTGILLHHRLNDRYLVDPHHLSFGSISAGLTGVELSDLPTNLFLLLDRVRLDAPTLFSP